MNTIKNEQKKKMLLVLPLLFIPFATMFFWALGGGKTAQAQASNLQGLNMQLPGAQLKNDSAENKLAFYEQAEKDSLKFKQERKDDPYYKGDSTIREDSLKHYDTGIIPKADGSIGGRTYSTYPLRTSNATLSANEQQISQKLAELNRQIAQPAQEQPANGSSNPDIELARMQAAMQKMNSSNTPDPEMQQLSGMLDKIQEIQNPGLAQQKLKEQSQKNRGQVFAVSGTKKDNPISVLDNSPQNTLSDGGQNGFYSFDQDIAAPDSQNAVEAVVHETQTLVAGATVKLRLVNDIYINGKRIPKDNFVFGVASLNGERLTIKITSLRYHNSIYPVDLSVFDIDGAEGIYIPGAITRDVAKESADQSIQNLGFTTYDPSIGAQAASAGITAAKTLFSRKVRLIKVTVKAGYQVLLRDEKQKQSS